MIIGAYTVPKTEQSELLTMIKSQKLILKFYLFIQNSVVLNRSMREVLLYITGKCCHSKEVRAHKKYIIWWDGNMEPFS